MNKKIAIIGSGISSLSAACYLAKDGFDVTVYEKNKHAGGRIDVLKDEGFTFDMGPSWYWMPEVFDRFYKSFGYKTSDFYNLVKLNPGFEIVYNNDDSVSVWSDLNEIYNEFEKIEKGSATQLKAYLKKAENIYAIAMGDMVYKPFVSWTDFIDSKALNIHLLSSLLFSVSYEVRKRFKHPYLRQLLEFPVIFLGSTAEKIPALYHLMNYAAFFQGTWYPQGGMYKVSEAFEKIAKNLGVTFKFNTPVKKILIENNQAVGVQTNDSDYKADIVLSGADYAFTELNLLSEPFRNYSLDYWNKKTFAPSALLFYLGINKKIEKLKHHTLFFDADFNNHIEKVYTTHQWPQKPLFYLSATSKTDPTVAPDNCENLVILVPISTEIEDNETAIDSIFKNVIKRLEEFTGELINPHIIYKKTVAKKHFTDTYNAFKGNAYGLANTLLQTATLKPKLINKKVSNLFYTGQLTVPGPGVPPSIISGEIVAKLIINKTH
jgi:phytoene desaturase